MGKFGVYNGERNILVSAVPNITSTTAYTEGDNIGGVLTFRNVSLQNGGSFTIRAVTIKDKEKQNPKVSLVLSLDEFSSDTIIQDNVSVNVADADADKLAGAVPVAVSNFTDLSGNSIATVPYELPIRLNSGRDIRGFLLFTDSVATPVYETADALTVTLHVRQDA